MASSVKSIFKTLLAAILIPIAISCIVEMFNVNVNSVRLKQLMKTSAYHACDIFAQESYRNNGSSATDVVYEERDANGGLTGNKTVVISRDIFNVDYDNIYGSSPSYLKFLGGDAPYYYSTDVITSEMASIAIAGTEEYDEKYTPTNVGVPYFDEGTTNNMFRWALAKILSNCDDDLIQKDESGEYYVNYNGFAVYFMRAKIDQYNYYKKDLNNSDDRKWLADTVHYFDAGSEDVGVLNGVDSDENNWVIVVGVGYEVPVRYIGITPIKRVFELAWNREVAGYNKDGDTAHSVTYDDNTGWTTSGRQYANPNSPDGNYYFEAQEDKINGGGYSGTGTKGMSSEAEFNEIHKKTLATIGTLFYTLER